MTPSVKVRSRDQTIREVGDDYVLQDGESLVAQLRSRAAKAAITAGLKCAPDTEPRMDQYRDCHGGLRPDRRARRSGGEHAEQRASSARR